MSTEAAPAVIDAGEDRNALGPQSRFQAIDRFLDRIFAGDRHQAGVRHDYLSAERGPTLYEIPAITHA